MKTRFAHKSLLQSPDSGGSFAVQIQRTPTAPKRGATQKPARISGKKTSLGDLLERADDRLMARLFR